MPNYLEIETQTEERANESPDIAWRNTQHESNEGPILAHHHATALAAYVSEMFNANHTH